MAYTRINWLKRIRQYANRITLTNVTGTTYDVAQVEGTVTQAGVPFTDTNMNAMDFALYLTNNTFSNTSGTDAYAINVVGLTSLTDLTGIPLKFITTVANTAACTLNVTSLGAKAITKDVTVALETGDILANSIVMVVYDGTQFQIMEMNGLVTKNGVQTMTNKTFNNAVFTGSIPTIGGLAMADSRNVRNETLTYPALENITVAEEINLVGGKWSNTSKSVKKLVENATGLTTLTIDNNGPLAQRDAESKFLSITDANLIEYSIDPATGVVTTGATVPHTLTGAVYPYALVYLGSNQFLVAYRVSTTSIALKVFSFDGATISGIGTAVTLVTESTTSKDITVQKIATGKIVISLAFAGTVTFNGLRLFAVTVSGTVPTIGTALNMEAIGQSCTPLAISQLGTDKFIVQWYNSTAVTYKLAVCTVATRTITAGSSYAIPSKAIVMPFSVSKSLFFYGSAAYLLSHAATTISANIIQLNNYDAVHTLIAKHNDSAILFGYISNVGYVAYTVNSYGVAKVADFIINGTVTTSVFSTTGNAIDPDREKLITRSWANTAINNKVLQVRRHNTTSNLMYLGSFDALYYADAMAADTASAGAALIGNLL